MILTTEQRLILSDSIDDVDVFITDMTKPDRPEFNLLEFVEFKTGKLKSKYDITDAEMTLDFLTTINTANDIGKAERVKNEYIGLRQARYAERNQDEMRYDDAKNGTNTWIEWQDQIRLDIPKPI